MKTPTYILACSLIAMMMACKDKEKAMVQNSTSSTAEQAADTGKLDQGTEMGVEAPADSLVLSLTKTPCFGTCKAYTINVYHSGHATYEGRSHVDLIGMYTAHIGADTIANLLAEAERIGFNKLEDKYDAAVTDLPSTIIRIVANGTDKKVVARVGTPAAFRGFADRMEGLLLPIAWRPVPAKD